MAVTIKDIARETGLGYATISAYLNGVTVRPENKEKIEAAVNKLGYIRNDYARGLKLHASMTIGILIPELSSLFSTTIITAIEDVLRERGYGIIVCDCRTDKALEQQAMRFLLSKMVDGLIVMPVSEDADAFDVVKSKGTPAVVIDRMTQDSDMTHIVINNREISCQAVKRLVDKGCRHIALIYGGEDVYTSRERRKGYKDALDEIDAYDPSYIYDGKLSVEGAYLAAKRILAERPDTDGFFVTNYEMTLGAIIAIKESGKSLGQDYAFVGFDMNELAKAFKPAVTVVDQPLREIGYTAANMILDKIAHKSTSDIVLQGVISDTDGVTG